MAHWVQWVWLGMLLSVWSCTIISRSFPKSSCVLSSLTSMLSSFSSELLRKVSGFVRISKRNFLWSLQELLLLGSDHLLVERQQVIPTSLPSCEAGHVGIRPKDAVME